MNVWPWLSQPWAVLVTTTLLHFLWQGTLLAALGVVVIHAVRWRTPQARCAVWLTTLVAMALAPFMTAALLERQSITSIAPTSLFAASDEAGSSVSPSATVVFDLMAQDDPTPLHSAPPTNPTQAAFAWPSFEFQAWQPALIGAWGLGVVALSLRLLIGTAWLIVLCRGLRPIPANLQHRCERLSRRIGLHRLPRLVVSPQIDEPFAWQLWRPLVVLPASWLADVPVEVLEAVIAHELAHIRRHDVWVNLLQRLVETFLFFHPCVWWVSRQIRTERELCCDADAVLATGQAVAYAQALEAVAIKRMACAGPQLAVGLGGTRMALLHRVKQVLGTESSAAESSWWSLGLAGMGMATVCWLALSFGTTTVQGDDAPAAVSADAVAQRDQGPPRGPRDADRPDAPRGPRDGERPPGTGPRDGDRPDGPRGPRDGEGPGPRGPEGRPGPRPEGREGPPFGPNGPFGPGGPRGEFGPPVEVMQEMMRSIRELREEVQMLRRELNEIRERGPMGPGRPGNEFRPPMGRPGAGPEGRPGPDGRDGDRGPRPEGREGDRGPRPEAREGDRGPRPEARDGDRGPRPEGREGDRPRPPEGRPGQPPRPEGREGDRPRPPEGRRPEGEDRPRRPEGDRAENEEQPVSAISAS